MGIRLWIGKKEVKESDREAWVVFRKEITIFFAIFSFEITAL